MLSVLANTKMTLTADTAREIQNRHAKVDDAIFNLIRKRCDARVKGIASVNKKMTSVDFSIPPFIFGRPVYDVMAMKKRLISSLTEDGFVAKPVTARPFVVNVSWKTHNTVSSFRKNYAPLFKSKRKGVVSV